MTWPARDARTRPRDDYNCPAGAEERVPCDTFAATPRPHSSCWADQTPCSPLSSRSNVCKSGRYSSRISHDSHPPLHHVVSWYQG